MENTCSTKVLLLVIETKMKGALLLIGSNSSFHLLHQNTLEDLPRYVYRKVKK